MHDSRTYHCHLGSGGSRCRRRCLGDSIDWSRRWGVARGRFAENGCNGRRVVGRRRMMSRRRVVGRRRGNGCQTKIYIVVLFVGDKTEPRLLK